MKQSSSVMNTALGALKIREEDGRICEISFTGESPTPHIEETPLLKQARIEIEDYFQGKRKQFDFPIQMKGTPFQIKVWQALQKIPYGETRSYKEIAEMIDQPKACRAVGGANNKNPLILVVPCHRVIGANGAMVGFGGGVDKKISLLLLEKIERNS